MAFNKNSFRLLPVTILMTGLLLGVKCVDVGMRILVPGAPSGTLPGSMVTAAQAAPAPAAPANTKAATIAEAASTKPEAPKPAPAAPEPPPVSAAERQLLQDLRGRRVELDDREKTLAERESVLAAAERQLSARVAELSALQARLEQLDGERRAHDDANWAGIVKVYETMKPREAALIFNDMDMSVLLQVVDRMKDSKAAPVLAAMQPDRARLLTGQLAALRTRAITVPDKAGAS